MSVDWRTVASLVGTVTKALALPLVGSGVFGSPVDAVFESMSGITTTGAMLVGATNFVLLYAVTQGRFGRLRESEELRWLIAVKTLRRDLFTEIHPDAVRPIRMSGSVVDEGTVRDVNAYIVLSLLIFAFLTVFVVVRTADSGLGVTEFDAMGIAAATFLILSDITT